MPIHEFEFDNGLDPLKLTNMQFDAKDRDGQPVEALAIAQRPLQDVASKTTIFFEDQNINKSEEVHEILPPGYRTMDRGLKNYFSGIKVPTKDDYRIMGVRVSGGDKPYLVWAPDLKRGRVTLPLMAIRRENDEHNPQKYSPAHTHYMAKRFLDTEGTKIALTYRPVPALINYSLSVWAEHKRDLEYIHYQIRTRFNPAAEFLVEDEYIRGSVFLRYNGMNSSIDDEMPADQRSNKRYDYSITMEGWLPLPEKVVPSILGRVVTLKEQVSGSAAGLTLETVLSQKDLPVIQTRRR